MKKIRSVGAAVALLVVAGCGTTSAVSVAKPTDASTATSPLANGPGPVTAPEPKEERISPKDAQLKGAFIDSKGYAVDLGTLGSWLGNADEPSGPGKMSFTFDPDGSYRGSDGCNTFSGTWAHENGQLKLSSPTYSTKVCPGYP